MATAYAFTSNGKSDIRLKFSVLAGKLMVEICDPCNSASEIEVPGDMFAQQHLLNMDIERAVRSKDPSERSRESLAMKHISEHANTLNTALRDALRDSEENLDKLLDSLLSTRRVSASSVLLSFAAGSGDWPTLAWETALSRQNGNFRDFVHWQPDTVIARLAADNPASPPADQVDMLFVTCKYHPDGPDLYGIPDAELEKAIQDQLKYLRQGLSGKRIAVWVLEDATIKEFSAALSGKCDRVKYLWDPEGEAAPANRRPPAEFAIVHYLGHGGWVANRVGNGNPETGAPFLTFYDANESCGLRSDWADVQICVARLSSVRLLTLAACDLENRFAMGSALVRRYGLPAVVTMKSKASDRLVKQFLSMYIELAAGKTVQQAYGSAIYDLRPNESSPVETFVPCLTLGTADALQIVNPDSPGAQAVRWEVNSDRGAQQQVPAMSWSQPGPMFNDLLERFKRLIGYSPAKSLDPLVAAFRDALSQGDVAISEWAFKKLEKTLPSRTQRTIQHWIDSAREDVSRLERPKELARIRGLLAPAVSEALPQSPLDKEIEKQSTEEMSFVYGCIRDRNWEEAHKACALLRERDPKFEGAARLHAQIIGGWIVECEERNDWKRVAWITQQILQDRELRSFMSPMAVAWQEEAGKIMRIYSTIQYIPPKTSRRKGKP